MKVQKSSLSPFLRGQVMVEYLILVSFVVLGLAAVFELLQQVLGKYYEFLVTVVCLPIP